jgi:hypothetical protein
MLKRSSQDVAIPVLRNPRVNTFCIGVVRGVVEHFVNKL